MSQELLDKSLGFDAHNDNHNILMNHKNHKTCIICSDNNNNNNNNKRVHVLIIVIVFLATFAALLKGAARTKHPACSSVHSGLGLAVYAASQP